MNPTIKGTNMLCILACPDKSCCLYETYTKYYNTKRGRLYSLTTTIIQNAIIIDDQYQFMIGHEAQM